MDTAALQAKATDIRKDILTMITEAGSGHPGGSLSCTDILTALYFGGVMDYNPADPHKPGRDRFILAKGHAAPALYAAKQLGRDRCCFYEDSLAGLLFVLSEICRQDQEPEPELETLEGPRG